VARQQPQRRLGHAGVLGVRECHPPRVADGRVAARERDRAQVSGPLRGCGVADEELPAPRVPAGAEAEAVERDPDDPTLQAVLGHHRRDVRVVVLDRDRGKTELVGEARRQEVGMQVVGDEVGRDPEDGAVPVERLAVRVHRLLGVEVADVLR
jgi:hypothetical protein